MHCVAVLNHLIANSTLTPLEKLPESAANYILWDIVDSWGPCDVSESITSSCALDRLMVCCRLQIPPKGTHNRVFYPSVPGCKHLVILECPHSSLKSETLPSESNSLGQPAPQYSSQAPLAQYYKWAAPESTT